MPALVSTPLVFYSEDAESVEVYWECTQEAPLVMGGTTGYQRSIGSDTFSRGRSIGTLIVRCVKTDDEVTYENFRASGTLQDTSLHNRGQHNFPTSTNGMTGANLIDSDGAITYFLRGSGADAERVRWAVKRETSTGNPPTQYLIKACENEGNSGMCYVPADDGEVNFLWKNAPVHVDLGFYGTGTYSYFACHTDGREFIGEAEPARKGLLSEVIQLLQEVK